MSIAVDNDGTFRGLKVDLVVDQGAYPGFPVGAPTVTRMMKVMFPGSYAWDAFEMRSRVVATNKGKYIAYRGPWANETWARERMVDIVAHTLRMSPAEVRLKNMIGEEQMPTAMITGPMIDETMSTKKTLERALELIDLEQFERDKATRRTRRQPLPRSRDRQLPRSRARPSRVLGLRQPRQRNAARRAGARRPSRPTGRSSSTRRRCRTARATRRPTARSSPTNSACRSTT